MKRRGLFRDLHKKYSGRRLLRVAGQAALAVGQALWQVGFLYVVPPPPPEEARHRAESSREAR